MSTKSITTILGTVAVIAIALGGYNLVFKKDKLADTLPESTSNVQGGEAENIQVQQPTGKKMAFSEFVKQDKGAYKCEVHQAMSDMENTGTVYISNGNMRGEFTTIAEGRTVDSSFISKDGYMYSWSSMAPSMGVKLHVVTTADGNTGADTQGTYMWKAEQIGDYNCEPWTADESKFTVPASIKFTEIKQ